MFSVRGSLCDCGERDADHDHGDRKRPTGVRDVYPDDVARDTSDEQAQTGDGVSIDESSDNRYS